MKKNTSNIEIFNSIRDIPYRIPLSFDDEAIDCDRKHKRLSEALEKEGIKTRYRVCSFLWSELDIPKEVLDIPHIDKCEHLYVEAFINEKWITLDVTWDNGLKNIFKINEWDGTSNTEIAVKPVEIYKPNKTILSHNETEASFMEDMKNSGAFYKALNEWLEISRV